MSVVASYTPRTQKRIRKHLKERKKPKPTTLQLQHQINRIKHQDELKYDDVYNTTALATTGTLLTLSSIGQGDDFDQRVGEEVLLKYLNMTLKFVHPAGTGGDFIRCILFWDLQTNGTGPVLFSSTSLNTGLLDDSVISNGVISPHNYRTKHRYKVLMDKCLTINPASSAVEPQLVFKKSISLHNARIKYSDSGATIASIVSRGLCFAILCTASTTAVPALGFRTWYIDA